MKQALASFIFLFIVLQLSAQEAYFTTGIKIGEVTETSAVLWTRLCAQEKPNPIKHERREKVFRHPIDFDEEMPVHEMDGAVKGQAGWIRASVYSEKENIILYWQEAKAEHDFTVQFSFNHLSPGITYKVVFEAKEKEDSDEILNTVEGSFTTAPSSDQPVPVNLTTSTCQYFWSYDQERGFKTYDRMRELKPDFFIQTGDYIYYDKPGPLAKNIEEARHKWHAMDSWPSLVDFHQMTPMYMIKDDHDLLKDDVYPESEPYGELTFEDGLSLWHENIPLVGKAYRSIRWGKDLEVWLVEGREYRSNNNMPDGESKTILGMEQIEWLKETIPASDATFKVFFSATPVVGPDRDRKKDNHSNSNFTYEGKWLRKFLSEQKNLYVVNGDRHWQYVSQDDETGLMEFGSGPVSDFHTQGWQEGDVRPEHKYLNLKGGFLNISVLRENGEPVIYFKHYDVDGKVLHVEEFRD